MRRKAYKSTIEFILFWPTTPGHGVCPEVWLIYPVILHWSKLIFPLPVGISCRWLLGSGVTCVRFPLSMLGPGLAWICACPVHAATVSVSSYGHQFCCVWRHCFLGIIHHLWLLQSLHLLFCIDPWALDGGFWWRHDKWSYHVFKSLEDQHPRMSGWGAGARWSFRLRNKENQGQHPGSFQVKGSRNYQQHTHEELIKTKSEIKLWCSARSGKTVSLCSFNTRFSFHVYTGFWESQPLSIFLTLVFSPLCVTVRIRLRASCIPIACFTPTLFSRCLRNLQGKCGATRQGHRPMRLQGRLFTFWSFRTFAHMAPCLLIYVDL